jgi:hypothetical protein
MMSATSASPEESKPYKGPESYQIEDAALFFGRDREAAQIIAKILSSRFTLVHAQSGAGKTSLINAHIIPGLEAHGWNAFRILPQDDPVAAVRSLTLRYVLPPPEAEAMAIQRAHHGLFAPDDDPTLNDLLDRYDALGIQDPQKRLLIAPVQVTSRSTAGLLPETGNINPLFCRLLRSTIEANEYAEHLAAIFQVISEPPPEMDSHTTISDTLQIMRDPRLIAAYRETLSELNVPVNDLSVFFEYLFRIYGQKRSQFRLVLILDQFEEMFTRFIDPGPTAPELIADLPNWRLRREFFNQFERLYNLNVAAYGHARASLATYPSAIEVNLPIRYVISMRDEYIAQLDSIRRIVGNLDNNSYHLSLLEKDQAAAAIKRPALEFGYTYADDCYKEIVDQLTKEDRFLEPAHLQLVCEKLWNERGRELAQQNSQENTSESTARIELNTFLDLGGTKGILRSFFRDYLEALDEFSRLETLEILEPLVTTSGTRNIIEWNRLVQVPFRDENKRVKLLKDLVNRTIVRTERRLGGYFVEITHEFLIGPILEAIRDALLQGAEYSRFRSALRTLERFEGVSFSGSSRLLSRQEFFHLK